MAVDTFDEQHTLHMLTLNVASMLESHKYTTLALTQIQILFKVGYLL